MSEEFLLLAPHYPAGSTVASYHLGETSYGLKFRLRCISGFDYAQELVLEPLTSCCGTNIQRPANWSSQAGPNIEYIHCGLCGEPVSSRPSNSSSLQISSRSDYHMLTGAPSTPEEWEHYTKQCLQEWHNEVLDDFTSILVSQGFFRWWQQLSNELLDIPVEFLQEQIYEIC